MNAMIIHPLDDVPEMKINVDDAGPMSMTLAVKISLLVLRCYLVFVVGLTVTTMVL